MVDVNTLLKNVSEDTLEHYGVLGMKWGVRKDRSSGRSEKKAEAKGARKDERWEKKRQAPGRGTGWSSRRSHAVAKKAVKTMKPELKAINKSPEFRSLKARAAIRKDRGYMKGRNPTSIAYKKAVSALYMKHVRAAAATELQVSPSGKWKESLFEGSNSWGVELEKVDDVKHEASADPKLDFKVRPIEDEDGYIVDLELVEDSAAQSDVAHLLDETGGDSLEHYGVLGMKWGVRKDPRTGKKSGSPAAGSKRAERSTKSLSPSNEVKNRSNTDRSAAKQRKANEKHQAKEGKKQAKIQERGDRQKAQQQKASERIKAGAEKQAAKRQAIKDKAAGKGEKAEAKAQKKSDRNEMNNAYFAAEAAKMQMQAASNRLMADLGSKYLKEHGAKALLPGSQARSQYLNEFSDKYTQLLNETVKQFGDYYPNYEIHFAGNMGNVTEPVAILLDKRKASHEGPPEVKFKYKSDGSIEGVQNEEEILKWIFEQGEDEDLKHWGVPGMKWGVRKDRNTGKRKGSPIAGTKAATRKGTKKRRQSARSEAKSMTNDQLRSANERMRLEQEFQKLRKQEKSGGNNTAKLIKDIGDTSAALASGVRTASEVIRLVNQLKK